MIVAAGTLLFARSGSGATHECKDAVVGVRCPDEPATVPNPFQLYKPLRSRETKQDLLWAELMGCFIVGSREKKCHSDILPYAVKNQKAEISTDKKYARWNYSSKCRNLTKGCCWLAGAEAWRLSGDNKMISLQNYKDAVARVSSSLFDDQVGQGVAC